MNLYELKELHVREVRDTKFQKSSRTLPPLHPERPGTIWRQPHLVIQISLPGLEGKEVRNLVAQGGAGRRRGRKVEQKCPSAKMCQCQEPTQSRTQLERELGENRNSSQIICSYYYYMRLSILITKLRVCELSKVTTKLLLLEHVRVISGTYLVGKKSFYSWINFIRIMRDKKKRCLITCHKPRLSNPLITHTFISDTSQNATKNNKRVRKRVKHCNSSYCWI